MNLIDEGTATVPDMKHSKHSDDSMFWTISPSSNGTFFFRNAATGLAWVLSLKPNLSLSMSRNLNSTVGKRFSFAGFGTIDDVRYSSIAVSGIAARRARFVYQH